MPRKKLRMPFIPSLIRVCVRAPNQNLICALFDCSLLVLPGGSKNWTFLYLMSHQRLDKDWIALSFWVPSRRSLGHKTTQQVFEWKKKSCQHRHLTGLLTLHSWKWIWDALCLLGQLLFKRKNLSRMAAGEEYVSYAGLLENTALIRLYVHPADTTAAFSDTTGSRGDARDVSS